MHAKQPPPILVAIDFSEHSEAALRWAADAADSFGCGLCVLHVVHDPGSAPGYYSRANKRQKHIHRLEEAAEEMMEEFLEEARQGYPHSEALQRLDRVLVVGLPVTRILEVADRVGAQLIVMGSRGRTGLPHLLLGSKAERVVQAAPVPVTIVKLPKKKKKKKKKEK